MQTNQQKSIIPIGINDVAPNALSTNTSTAPQSVHQLPQVDFSGSNNSVHGISIDSIQGGISNDSICRPFSDSVNEASSQDENIVPALINLETSGLWRLP